MTTSFARIPNPSAISAYIENDSRNIGGPGSDQAYTNGFKISYIFQTPKTTETQNEIMGYSVGQQIYGPNNIDRTDLITEDRPYAGWLYVGFAKSYYRKNSGHFIELDLGLVGPSALGKQSQNNFHDLIRIHRAQGWPHGLNDEPTLQLNYQNRYHILIHKNFDFFPYVGGAIGNVLTGFHLGGLIRFGYQLQDDFGPNLPSTGQGDSFSIPPKLSPETKNSTYTFFGFRMNAVAHNIFLDGNTFQESHKVEKTPLVYETQMGLGLQIQPFLTTWSFISRSVEFREQSRVTSFASVNLIYYF